MNKIFVSILFLATLSPSYTIADIHLNKKGRVPMSTTAEATCETGSIRCDYRVSCGENPSPLRKISYHGKEVCKINSTGFWTRDLKGQTLAGLDFICSHGRDEVTPSTATTGNAITHWYLQLHNKPILVVRHKYHRIPEDLESFSVELERAMNKLNYRL